MAPTAPCDVSQGLQGRLAGPRGALGNMSRTPVYSSPRRLHGLLLNDDLRPKTAARTGSRGTENWQINEISKRASEHLPAVLLTLLSIVQAVALESLWSHTISHVNFGAFSPLDILSLSLAAATLAVIVLVWLSYVSLLMRFIWVPSLADTSLPIFVGVAQFALIESATLDRIGYWFLILALIMAMVTGINQRFFRKARQDPRNREFFDGISPATRRDLLPQIIYAFAGLVMGVGFLLFKPSNWLAIVCVLIVIGVACHFAVMLNHYWNRSVRPTIPSRSAQDPDAM